MGISPLMVGFPVRKFASPFRRFLGGDWAEIWPSFHGSLHGCESLDTRELARADTGSAPFCCSRCFGRKLSASDVSFAAGILDRHRFGHLNDSKTPRCFPLIFVNEYYACKDGMTGKTD
jgi:hypothetical protein